MIVAGQEIMRAQGSLAISVVYGAFRGERNKGHHEAMQTLPLSYIGLLDAKSASLSSTSDESRISTAALCVANFQTQTRTCCDRDRLL